MKILIIAGTGAMGKALVSLLAENPDNYIDVTSRQIRTSFGNVHYIQGNAKERAFLDSLLQNHYDVIVDFMVYGTDQFEERCESFLNATDQYVFLSSARVYAPSDDLLTEDSPRLLDVCQDEEYLHTNEYALAKAREENFLFKSSSKHYTIVRPSLTYNDNRLQLAIWEKEEWLYRAIRGKKIIFPKQLESVITTMSWGNDVSYAISKLIGNSKSYGEAVHIAGAESKTWGEILKIYRTCFENKTGAPLKVYFAKDLEGLSRDFKRVYQTRYARGISRQFDNSKLESIIGKISFASPEQGLANCMSAFFDAKPELQKLDWKTEAKMDKISKDFQWPLEFSRKNKLKYILARFTDRYERLHK